VPGKSRLIVPLVAILVVVAGVWGSIAAFNVKPRLGLDLRGGTSVTFKPHNPNGGTPTKQQIDTTIDIIRNRVNSKGVAESEVTNEGGSIVVAIPDVKNSDDVIRAVGTTAQLQFRPVLAEAGPSDPKKYKQAPFDKVDCAKPDTWLATDKPNQQTILCATEPGQQRPSADATKLQMGSVALGGTDITGAHAQIQQASNGVSTGQWQTALSFSSKGNAAFEKLTGQAACNPSGDPKRQIAIILDSVVINHPPVAEDDPQISCNHGINNGGVINGQTQSEAEFLAPLIATGALPLTLQNIDQNTVSATLGADSLRAGLIAGILGLAATFVYVLLFYRGLGLVIWGGLAIAAALNVGIVLLMGRLIGFTLTLAGIAGLIVAIGISADSYVVFFERLKDEVREGRTLRTSVDRGWARSFHTLVSANTVSFAAALVLYVFAIGPVRGFAFTLGLATLIDFFAVWCYGRPAVSLLTRTRLFQEGRFVGIRAAV
jgi:preprotein translocase subunit SecD